MRASVVVPGTRYGYLTVESGFIRDGETHVWCVCDCSNRIAVRFTYLKNGHTKSCRCRTKRAFDAYREMRKENKVTGTPEHRVWISMLSRCYSKTNVNYHNYGGRGILMHDEWRANFNAFLAYVGKRPGTEYSIDRIDNERGYFPGNVRWATCEQQNSNKRGLRFLTYRDETLTLSQWARRFNLPQPRLHQRIVTLGWDIHRALTTPIRHYRKH